MRKAIKITRMKGLTLVELLIAATLSILLLTGAVSIFVASKETFNVGEDMARVQESIRYASTRMIKDISTAGYMGCAPSSDTSGMNLVAEAITVPGIVAGTLGDFTQIIIGGESTGPNNSDSLTVHYAQVETAIPLNTVSGALSAGDASGGQTVNITANTSLPDYAMGDDIVISDCQKMMIARLTANPTANSFVHTGLGTTDKFGGSSDTQSMVYRMDGATYQLNTVGPDTDGRFVSTLMATRLNGNQQPILDGVENFQVEYGIDANGDRVAERYLDWTQVVAGGNQFDVVSVRVTIMVNSGDPVADPLGQNPTFRKSSTFTVALRNYGV